MRSFLVLSLAMSLGCSSSVVAPTDTGAPDTATPDTATPDTATPDTATPDVTPQDAASTDRVEAIDVADLQDVPQDLSRLDLMTVPDQGVDVFSIDVVPAMDAPTDSRADIVDVATAPDARADVVLVDTPDVTDVPPTDVGCPVAGQRLCGGVCVNTATDPANCGACGNACCAGQVCGAGVCLLTCPAGMTACSRAGSSCGACVDTQTDNMNCGACGNACPAGVACRGGSCLPCGGCPTGSSCCGGACVDTRITNAHCGACDRPCCAGNLCSAGTCTPGCTPGLTACPLPSPTTCFGGTCNDLRTDVGNCGACGRRCATGETCVAGACQSAGFMALTPCASPSDYTAGTTVRFGDAVGLAYSPRCVTVHAGETVTWQGSFGGHPLAPATTRGSAGNPIPSTSTGTSVTVTFPAAGFFPYYCAFHGSSAGSGMAGVVQVVP